MDTDADPRAVLSTRFTELLGVEHPILLAPMAGSTDAALAVAVSAAGAVGGVGAMHPHRPDEWVAAEVAAIAAATDRPFVVGFITPFIEYMPSRFDAALEARVPAVMLSFGDVEPWAGRAHDAGCRVVAQVQTPRQALAALDAGVDVLVTQGNEAGGHTGAMGLVPLLASVLDLDPHVPVLAAGGIGSGRALAGVLAMGADGACLGTALLAATEATPSNPAVPALIERSDGTDTVWTSTIDVALEWPFPDGIRVRTHATDFTREWEGREQELRARRDTIVGAIGVDELERTVAMYGQSAGQVRGVRPAADIVAGIVRDAAAALRRSHDRLR